MTPIKAYWVQRNSPGVTCWKCWPHSAQDSTNTGSPYNPGARQPPTCQLLHSSLLQHCCSGLKVKPHSLLTLLLFSQHPQGGVVVLLPAGCVVFVDCAWHFSTPCRPCCGSNPWRIVYTSGRLGETRGLWAMWEANVSMNSSHEMQYFTCENKKYWPILCFFCTPPPSAFNFTLSAQVKLTFLFTHRERKEERQQGTKRRRGDIILHTTINLDENEVSLFLLFIVYYTFSPFYTYHFDDIWGRQKCSTCSVWYRTRKFISPWWSRPYEGISSPHC